MYIDKVLMRFSMESKRKGSYPCLMASSLRKCVLRKMKEGAHDLYIGLIMYAMLCTLADVSHFEFKSKIQV